MKKFFIIVLITLLLLAGCNNKPTEPDEVPVETLIQTANFELNHALQAKNYALANTIYTEQSDEIKTALNQTLDSYIDVLLTDIKKSENIEAAKQAYNDFLVIEYTTSKTAVLDEFLLSYENSIMSFAEGQIKYEERAFDEALTLLGNVIEEDTNYETAVEYISEITKRNTDLQNAIDTKAYGRNSNPYAATIVDGFMYLPYSKDGVHSILKVNNESYQTEIFPLYECAGTFYIRGINVIGDYIYFAMGENVGTGRMIDSPYAIYEMKTDGSGLVKLADGDYYDLISYAGEFYALSYKKGLVKFDQKFENETVLIEGDIVEFTMAEEGIYYTLRDNLDFDTDEINVEHHVYLYKDGQSTLLREDEQVHAYYYGDKVVYTTENGSWQEKIYIADTNYENRTQVVNGDLMYLYGMVGDTIIYSLSGEYNQEQFKTYDVINKNTSTISGESEITEYDILSFDYDNNKIIVDTKEGIKIASLSFAAETTLDIPAHDADLLAANKERFAALTDDDFYTDEEVIVASEHFWYYSNVDLNVTIENYYIEDCDSAVFVAHVRTKDMSKMDIYYNHETPPGFDQRTSPINIARRGQVVFAQNTDYWSWPDNTWTGIIIRRGEIFKSALREDMMAVMPDGRLVGYQSGDDITAEELVEMGVYNTFSFGPIILDGFEYGEECTTDWLRGRNPRSAMGMVEPGHYVHIITDGRSTDRSRGTTHIRTANMFLDEGCSFAYNFDGGQSTTFMFMGNYLNTHGYDARWTTYRRMPEVLGYGTNPDIPLDLSEYWVD